METCIKIIMSFIIYESIMSIFVLFIHCELANRRIHVTLLVRFCDLIAILVKLSGYILEFQNIFLPLNSSLIKGDMIERFKYYVLFTLVRRDVGW